jgi:Zn-dependent protease/predicted transcriptional regulator
MVKRAKRTDVGAHTIVNMSGWSFRIGKIFGIEVRLHSFFVFLLAPAAVWAVVMGRPPMRGVALWGLLVMAVLVREIARGVAAAYFYLDVKSLLLLPTGGLLTYAGIESESRAGQPGIQRGMALVGPLANIVFGLMVAGLIVTVSPGVPLLAMPWVSPAHLLRTMVWVNLLLGALNFLPAWPLDGGRVVRSEVVRGAGVGTPAARMLPGRLGVLVRMSRWIALSLIIYGVVAPNLWVMMAGLGVLLGAQVERQGLLPERETDSTRVGDVMLTEYSILPASATLEDAMMAARHSLQDVFPVVRAGNMVGAVARQSILEALATSGNGYVQGIMTRSFQTAGVNDSLMETLNQAVGQSAGASLQIVPVVEGDAVVGILTPQHLQRSLGLISRRVVRAGRSAEDEID